MIKTINPSTSNKYHWIQLIEAASEEIDRLVADYNFPRDFLTSSLDSDEVARIEKHTNSKGEEYTLLVIIYPFVLENEDIRLRYQTQAISIIFNHELLITSHRASFQDIFSRLLTESDKTVFETPTMITLELLWLIARTFLHFIAELESMIMELEMTVVDRTENEIFYQLMGINRGLVNFQVAIDQNQSVIQSLNYIDYSNEPVEVLHGKIHDVSIEQKQAQSTIHRLKQYSDKISDILSNVVNNNLNNIMRVLTVWSIILTIPTIISGIWGMNVPLPFSDNNFAHLLLNFSSLILMVVIYWLFKKNKWI
ncbi:magnesium transporter CorA family protein [Fundicoccus culcitae]|uniref:Magnesium transporter CorA family protein n=1 Tax=Fundicoccus culcitae TaxID=2969821 RepID=A0ABY5P3A9_9LACT|nr:magnesium transporter CorA family protein [Fundicoccus culcitae]UUX33100.1 magnesium transporter CorA family protein [Fundicoccus culcitae]